MDLVERAKNRVVEEIRRQSDGSWPMDGDEEVGLVDAHIDFAALGKSVITEVLDAVQHELNMTELANIEGAMPDWLAGFQCAAERLSHLRKEAGIE